MGIFGSKKLSIRCDSCKKKINDYEFVWIDEHKFCQDCAAKIQGGAPNVFVQNGGAPLQGLNSDSHNYEMNIDDIFFANNRGTVLCGTIKKGTVRLNDVVCVGNKKYNVLGIECSKTLLSEALCGMNIGLLIDCFMPHSINVGDVVTGLSIEEDSKLSADSDVKKQPLSDAQITALKKYALKFLPQVMDTPEAYKSVIDILSKVIPTINLSIMDAKIRAIIETNNLQDIVIGDFYVMLAQEIEKCLGVTRKEKIMESVAELDDDVVLSVWISLDMFAFALGKGLKNEIDDFCSSFFEFINQRGITAPQPPADTVQPQDVQLQTCNADEDVLNPPQSAEFLPVEFEDIKQRCFEVSKSAPASAELAELKLKLGQMILELDNIWVAYDSDFNGMYPYVALNGRMEIFTKEEYALGAQNYYASCNEGHFIITKHSKEEIKKFFKNMLYMGVVHFMLDNGVTPIDMCTEEFLPYQNPNCIDNKNRTIRCYLMRYKQILYRYNKISDPEAKQQKTELYQNVLSAFLSGGITALVNGVMYVLGSGSYTEGVSLYTKSAFEKLKLANHSKGIYDDSVFVCQNDSDYGLVEGISSAETVKNPSLGEFVAVFTDKAQAQKLWADFKAVDSHFNCSIVAVTFEEAVKYAMECDGMIVDVSAYGHIIEKTKLIDIQNQALSQQS